MEKVLRTSSGKRFFEVVNLECGNTEAEGFLCRFHFSDRKAWRDEKGFFPW
ncbi:MAG: hypothetical protein K6C40_08815 [Thermoguttaceae bacterium]|nr:hypothetical protein [Thermoguttaceae bacterium]